MARCPLCGKRSKRVHSRYQRTLADLPWAEYAVTIRLSVRRLFCDNARCERRIFAELKLPHSRGVLGSLGGYGSVVTASIAAS